MKDFTATKYLLEVIEEHVVSIEGEKNWTLKCLENEQTRKANLYYDEEGEAHSKTNDGEVEDLTRWDVERIDIHIRDYEAKITAYDTVQEILSNIDLNKIMKGGAKK